MEFRGTVQGEAARKYAGYTYRKALIEPLTLHSADPDRLNPMHEFPRFCPPPSLDGPRIVDLANYMVKFGQTGHDGMATVEVFVMPNEYTAAKEPMGVLRFHVAHPFILRHTYVDEALKRAFSPR